MLHIVPPIAIVLSKHPNVKDYDLSSVHSALSAAAPMGKDLELNLMKVLNIQTVKQGVSLIQNMGMPLLKCG